MNEFWFQVRFVLNALCGGPEVSKVYLSGDFNQWKLLDAYQMKTCPEGFSLTLPLSQGYYQYKYVLCVPSEETIDENKVETKVNDAENNGADKTEQESDKFDGCTTSDNSENSNQRDSNTEQIWIRDPVNPHVGGAHGNSIMFVHMDPGVYGIRPQHTPLRDYRRWESDGSEFHTLCPPLPPQIEALGILQRLLFVYLPPSYSREETRKYPVLYANDGQALFSTPAHAGGPCKGGYYLDEKLDYFWNKKLLPEFILVGVPNSDFVCIGNRNREYCTSVFHDTSNDPYKRYLVEVVKKEIDNKYRTLPDSGNTVIMGSSMGGLCAFALSLNHPDIFSSAVCISSSFWFVDKSNKSAYDLLRSRSCNNPPNSTTPYSNDNACNEGCDGMSKLDISTSTSSDSEGFVSASTSFSAKSNPPMDYSTALTSVSPTTVSATLLPDSPASSFSPPDFRPRIYIDSGDGPGDNFYETKEMRETFLECGWKEGKEFMYVLDEYAKKTGDDITHLEVIWKERMLPALKFAFKVASI